MSDVRRISKTEKVALDELHIRYVPELTPLWPGMRLVDSPHVELLQIYREKGNSWKWLKGSRYVKERQHRYALGMKRWTDKYIRSHHLPKRFAIYESIKRKGYDKRFPIKVLRQPFWKTRFGYQIEGYEIWTGAGRASSMVVLGKRTITCQWYEDTMPGTNNRGKFGKKIPFKCVWNATFGKNSTMG